MTSNSARFDRQSKIRSLFDDYIEMYAGRDDRLTTRFSDNFSGYTGGGDFLVRDRAEWVRITRQDFAQVTGRIRIEMLDLELQDISDDVVVATAFFHIHLPMLESVLASEVARLVLIFRLEGARPQRKGRHCGLPRYHSRNYRAQIAGRASAPTGVL